MAPQWSQVLNQYCSMLSGRGTTGLEFTGFPVYLDPEARLELSSTTISFDLMCVALSCENCL